MRIDKLVVEGDVQLKLQPMQKGVTSGGPERKRAQCFLADVEDTNDPRYELRALSTGPPSDNRQVILTLLKPVRVPLVRLCATRLHGYAPHYHYFDESGFHYQEAANLPTGSTIESMIMALAEHLTILGLHVQEQMEMEVTEDDS